MSAAPGPSARQVLEPCPFCNKAMQYRAALFASDGCTDAVIHAEPTDCGLVQFDIGATDGGVSTIAAWNRRSGADRAAMVEECEPALVLAETIIRQIPQNGKYWDTISRFWAAVSQIRALKSAGEEKDHG